MKFSSRINEFGFMSLDPSRANPGTDMRLTNSSAPQMPVRKLEWSTAHQFSPVET